jgi:hypothetical protein
MRLLAIFILAAGSIVGLTGCETAEQRDDPNRVSNIPWNRPEKWEGQGALGGFNPQQN